MVFNLSLISAGAAAVAFVISAGVDLFQKMNSGAGSHVIAAISAAGAVNALALIVSAFNPHVLLTMDPVSVVIAGLTVAYVSVKELFTRRGSK